jgi:hypothetical protein
LDLKGRRLQGIGTLDTTKLNNSLEAVEDSVEGTATIKRLHPTGVTQ